MPRRAFITDLQAASASQLPEGFFDLKQADEDGSFTVAYKQPPPSSSSYLNNSATTVLQVTVDVDEYPLAHSNFVYVITDAAPDFVEAAISDASLFDGLKVLPLVTKLGKLFDAASAGLEQDFPIGLDDENEEGEIEDELVDVDGLSDEDDFDQDPFDDPFSFNNATSSSTPTSRIVFANKKDEIELDERIRSDLRSVKQAGFHISCHGDPFAGGKDFYLTISCRIRKFNISEDALNAWGLSPEQYFLLIIHFTNGYHSLQDVLKSTSGPSSRAHVSFRTGICSKRKISRQHTIDCFSTVDTHKMDAHQREQREHREQQEHELRQQQNSSSGLSSGRDPSKSTIAAAMATAADAASTQLQKYFIDVPMNELLNGRFLDILRARDTWGLCWSGAEQFCQDYQAMAVASDEIDAKYWQAEAVGWKTAPSLHINDHFSTAESPAHASFPLIAIEFTLRHLIHCTEFCLVCHTHLDVSFEALKPYVCSKGLCLYQYMALGFGPLIEHEIVNQPYVVDLLVSLCYRRALSGTLQDMPIGMGLQVPALTFLTGAMAAQPGPRNTTTTTASTTTATATATSVATATAQQQSQEGSSIPGRCSQWNGNYDTASQKFVARWDPAEAEPNLRVGDWVAVRVFENEKDHLFEAQCLFRKIDYIALPTIMFHSQDYPIPPASDERKPKHHARKPAAAAAATSATGPVASSLSAQRRAVLHRIDRKFDDESADVRATYIAALLDLLPPVRDMKCALLDNGRRRTLVQAFPSVLPTAFNVLRWVVASNRSCIVAIDDLESAKPNTAHRVQGMPGYMQFRFAQGNPDKEHRFINAVNATQMQTGKAQPTLWAWHGSAPSNWHSIIREGLHYNSVVNGRAYGHGVYFALEPSVSQGYTGMRAPHSNSAMGQLALGLCADWRASDLNLRSVLSLNEIVNDPASFRSSSPYLVVQHLDWIQPRYLFVQLGISQDKQNNLMEGTENAGKTRHDDIVQDGTYRAFGAHHHGLGIPKSAISASRHGKPASKPATFGASLMKKMKISGRGGGGGGGDGGRATKDSDDVLMSDVTDDEDLALIGQGSKFRTVVDLTADSPPPSGPTSPSKRNSIGEVKSKVDQARKKDKPKTDFVPGSLDVMTLPRLPNPPYATPSASKALARELKELQKTQANGDTVELGWYLCEEALDNLYQWIIELHSFDPSEELAKDMKSKGLTSIVCELRFGPTFPYSPPFVRVIRPRFLEFRLGGGGHVTGGGAMCMELLTNDGWNVATSIEAVLLQIRLALVCPGRPARLAPGKQAGSYSAGEAVEAYRRVCAAHGWKIPADFSIIAAQKPE